MLKTIFAGSRFFVGLAVFGSFLGSVVLLITATLTVFRLAWSVVLDVYQALGNFPTGKSSLLNPRSVEHLGVQFIQLVDIVLLGVVMYIVAAGLYQLFFAKQLPLPHWLQVHDLVELKRDLISVTVVLYGVTFLGVVVDWNPGDPGEAILFVGAGIALVVFALGLILWLTPDSGPRSAGDHVHPGKEGVTPETVPVPSTGGEADQRAVSE